MLTICIWAQSLLQEALCKGLSRLFTGFSFLLFVAGVFFFLWLSTQGAPAQSSRKKNKNATGNFKAKDQRMIFSQLTFCRVPTGWSLDNLNREQRKENSSALHKKAKQLRCCILQEKTMYYYSTLDMQSWEKNRTSHYLTRCLRKYICSHIFIQTGERRWTKGGWVTGLLRAAAAVLQPWLNL